MFQAGFHRWLRTPLITGRLAVLCGLAAVGVPTMVRAAIDGVVTGCEFTPYLPFVLITALALGWWQAGAVALASAAILGGVLSGPAEQYFTSSCFISGAAIFLASSAMMIGVVVLLTDDQTLRLSQTRQQLLRRKYLAAAQIADISAHRRNRHVLTPREQHQRQQPQSTHATPQ